MRERIHEVFPQCNSNGCLEINNNEKICIIDEENQKCRIVENSEENYNFTILNPNTKEIIFLAIDKCLFNDGSDHKKCDFAVFDNQIFCFVEIKDTINRSSEHKGKAKIQLRATIEIFKGQIDFNDYQIEAIISW